MKQTWNLNTSVSDDRWDAFLTGSPWGEFPQSSFWSAYKAVSGWKCHRTIIAENDRVEGGFQILLRNTRFGPVGYINKGPVLAHDCINAHKSIVDTIIQAAHDIKLMAVILQLPARATASGMGLPDKLFTAARYMGIVTATLLLDISGDMAMIESKIKKTMRKKIQKASKDGVRVREGEEKDLAIFFKLMLETCNRQKAPPNPSNLNELVALYQGARLAANPCRFTLAEYDGRAVAGLFCIPFNETLSFFKKGSLINYLHTNAIALLYYEAIGWAKSQGFNVCDFGSLDKRLAVGMIENRQGIQKRGSRDIFHLSFGADPVLLPEPYVYFPHRFISWGHRLFTSSPAGCWLLKKYCERTV